MQEALWFLRQVAQVRPSNTQVKPSQPQVDPRQPQVIPRRPPAQAESAVSTLVEPSHKAAPGPIVYYRLEYVRTYVICQGHAQAIRTYVYIILSTYVRTYVIRRGHAQAFYAIDHNAYVRSSQRPCPCII